MPHTGPVTLLSRAFVGRDAELTALQEAWRQGGAARVVSSAAGVGKSRLVRELASWALTAGGLVLTGRCSPTGQDTPLRPWREALLAAARAGDRPAPTSMRSCRPWRGWCPSGATPRPTASALVLGEAVVAAAVVVDCPERPPLLVVEDLHWADPESLAVLEYVVDNLAGAPLLVVATLRDGEPGPGRRPGRRPDRPAGRPCPAARSP